MQTSLTFKLYIHGVPKILVLIKKNVQVLYWDWSDGSVVQSTDDSSRGPGFGTQHSHGSSQPPNSSPGGPDALFWRPRELHAHGAQKHI